ncbi:hypothetical protein [Streptomyces sp. NPDC047315]|uniref:hypothetical protein n=1 Tax=Streptomyces sp. NPDC047315 TaxID=3155142 RepID=UPI0033D1DD79
MRARKGAGARRTARTALAVVALTLLAACGPGDDGDGRGDGVGRGDLDRKPTGAAESPKAATGTLEELAAKVDCAPNVRTDTEELRQANCRTADGAYVLTTFATERGLREWLDAADDYGGAYLVGRAWVVSGGEAAVTALRGRLGGEVHQGADHGADQGAGDGSEHGHH